MKRKRLKMISMLMCTVMVLTFAPNSMEANAASNAADPILTGTGVQTWDTIYFGNYWQEAYEPNNVPANPEDGKIYTDSDGTQFICSEKTVYNSEDESTTVYAYSVKSPIKWRILSVDNNNNALIMADKAIDYREYNESQTDVTWEKSTLRSWMNGYNSTNNDCQIDYTASNFIDTAFSSEEKGEILYSDVENADNPVCGAKGGKSTTDKVFLLSLDDVKNEDYGFGGFQCKETRVAEPTDYVSQQDSELRNHWWLRSPGATNTYASWVEEDGEIHDAGNKRVDTYLMVRPALQINLSSTYITTASEVSVPRWKKDDKVTWDAIYFGNYYQENGEEKTPIKWRVLSIDDDNTALVVSDVSLDYKPFNETSVDVTWENSTLRSWLNGLGATENVDNKDYTDSNFLNEAFSVEEQKAIKTSTVSNKDYKSEYNEDEDIVEAEVTKADTQDKVFILSRDEVSNSEYGFCNIVSKTSPTRDCDASEYAKSKGARSWNSDTNIPWLIRNVYEDSGYAGLVNPIVVDYGKFLCDQAGNSPGRGGVTVNASVRPVMRVDLTSQYVTSADLVSAEMVDSAEEHTHEFRLSSWDSKKATCCSYGWETYICNSDLCEYTKKIEKDPSNHEGGTEIKNAVAASIGVPGYTGDTYCKGCGALLLKGSEIPALQGITADNTTVTTPADTSEPELKKQKITSITNKSIKASKLKSKKYTINLRAKTNGDGKLTFKISCASKLKKYINVSKKGVVTIKKGAKKGSYKVKITASETTKYKKATKIVTIKVK